MSGYAVRTGVQVVNGADLSKQARSLWAKTDREDDSVWLPLYIHLSDAAHTMGRLWNEWLPRNLRELFTRHFDGREDLARKALVFLAGAHDIGKATPIFQAKPIGRDQDGSPLSLACKPEKAGLFVQASLSTEKKPTHPIAGQVLLKGYLQEAFGWSDKRADDWGSIVGAHHGTVPDSGRLLDARASEVELGHNLKDVGESWQHVQRELLDFTWWMADLTNEDMQTLAKCTWDAPTESVACGLLIMADWIASNADLFPLVPLIPGADSRSDHATDEHGTSLDERAEKAWRELDLSPSWSGENPTATASWFCSRFGLPEGSTPRPVQQVAMEASEQMTEPSLMVIEAPMGEGKTEAALAAAEILGARFGCGGVCVALPTMATTDAMFGRVRRWLDHIEADGPSSIYLAHGKAWLNEEYQGIIRSSRAHRSLSSIGVDLEEGAVRDERVVVSDWFQGRKKGMLSSFVVCTVDQVLMGALNMKHLSLRHLALAGKVVIIDECHAYDSYMQQYLRRVLEWLGTWGCPVILLSATLPASVRDMLVNAYRGDSQEKCPASAVDGSETLAGPPQKKLSRKERARAKRVRPEPTPVTEPIDASYPLVTVALKSDDSKSNALRYECDASSRSTEIGLSILQDDPDSLIELLSVELAEGGVAGVICDTVTRAQTVYRALKDCFGTTRSCLLTHARFMDLDRMANERKLRSLLGPNATRANGKRPERMIVVGTQVLEQSLDIDFDLLVTDVAPIDLLMQRMGRVHRHARGMGEADRPSGLRQARCYLRGIKEMKPEGPEFSSGVSKVYDQASLMESLAVSGLCRMNANVDLSLPQDIARLVRLAYAPAVTGEIPGGWRDSYRDACDERESAIQEKRQRAEAYLLPSALRLVKNEKTLTGLFGLAIEGGNDSKMNEDAGQRAVRDTQETVEVLLVRREGDHVSLLPWVGDEEHGVERGQEIPTAFEPDWGLVSVLAQCAVRLPLSLCQPSKLDTLIKELEAGCERWVMAWQDIPILSGRLVLAMEEIEGESGVFEANVLDQRVRYSVDQGLSTARRLL